MFTARVLHDAAQRGIVRLGRAALLHRDRDFLAMRENAFDILSQRANIVALRVSKNASHERSRRFWGWGVFKGGRVGRGRRRGAAGRASRRSLPTFPLRGDRGRGTPRPIPPGVQWPGGRIDRYAARRLAHPVLKPTESPPSCCCSFETSPGEFLDKLTILEIKSERMSDAAKGANVRRESWRCCARRGAHRPVGAT